MAYYSGNDPASQYNQTDANSIQQRQLKRRRLGQAVLGQTTSETPTEPEAPVEQPEAPRTGRNGTQRMIRPITDRGQAISRPYSQEQPQPGVDLFNTENSGAVTGSAKNPLLTALTGSQPTETPKPTVDTSQWDTDGWGTPQYTGKAAGGAMAGWNQENWDNPNMQTPKYVVGRILSNYDPSGEGLTAAMQEIQQAYPGATFDGKDKVTIPGLGVIDVLVNAGGENRSWAWQDQTNGPGAQGSALQAAVLGNAGETMNPAQSILDGLDPSILQNPQWREMLKSLGVNI